MRVVRPLALLAAVLSSGVPHAQTAAPRPAGGRPLPGLFRTAAGHVLTPGADDVEAAAPEAAAASLFSLLPVGLAPEGDNPVAVVYTPSGDRVLVLASYSGTLLVLDPETLETLGTVDVGGSALAVAASDSVAVVTRSGTRDALVVDLATLQTRAVPSVGAAPIRVAMHPDGHLAYVGDASAQSCAIVDVRAGVVRARISGFPVSLGAGTTFDVRQRVIPTEFAVTRGAVVNYGGATSGGGARLLFYDPETGARLDTLVVGGGSLRAFAVSADGKRLFAADPFFARQLYRVDLATRTLDGVFTLPGSLQTYGFGLVPDSTGERVLLAATEPGGFARNVAVDFETGALTTHTVTDLFYEWRGGDGRHAVAGGYGETPVVVDLATGAARPFAVPYASSVLGAVSPRGDGFVTVTMPTAERVLRYGIDGTLLVDRVLGEEPEHDGPVDAVLMPDGARALLSFAVSRELAFLDLATRAVTAAIPVPLNPSTLAVSPDGAVALVASQFTAPLRLLAVDLASGAVLGEAAIPGTVDADRVEDILFPGGPLVYVVANQASPRTTTFVFRWTGAALSYEGPLPFHASGAALSPDRSLVLAADDDHAEAVLLDAATGAEIGRAPAGGAPFAAAFSPDGTRAAVASRTGPSLALYDVTPASLTAAATAPTVADANVVAFDATGALVAVGGGSLYPPLGVGAFAVHEAQTGAYVRTATATRRPVVALAAFPDSSAVALSLGVFVGPTAGGVFADLYEGAVRTALPGPAENLLVLPGGGVVLVPIQGPDLLGLLDRAAVAAEPGPGGAAPLAVTASPNPSPGPVTITVRRGIAGARVEVFDALGRRAFYADVPPGSGPATVVWDARAAGAAAGAYVVRATAGGRTAAARFSLTR